MNEPGGIRRVKVRSGWLLNNHVNIPTDVWRPLLGDTADNTFEVVVRFGSTGTGELNRSNGHLTGVRRAFDLLGITAADVDRRELRVWGLLAIEGTRRVYLEEAPRRSFLEERVGQHLVAAPTDEIFFLDRAESAIFAYRGTAAKPGDAAPAVEWLDSPASVVLPAGRDGEPQSMEPTAADEFRRVVLRQAVSLEPLATSDLGTAEEGGALLRAHKVRERSSRLVREKLQHYAGHSPLLPCEVCGFSFRNTYGVRGEGFAEVHHLHPLGEQLGVRLTTLNDLAVVCGNCHRMLHRPPFMSPEQLRVLLAATTE